MPKLLTTEKMIPFIVALSFFMEAVDSTVINTAIPAMSQSLRVNPIDLKMALISYLLSLAIFIPISGWLADKFGAKKVFVSALYIFTLGSLWCGFSHHLTELIIARFIQGIGGAFGLPVGRLIILRAFGRQNLITMMNRIVTVGALGMVLGPVIGGFITHYFSWQWIFWLNIPIGIFSILLAKYWLQEAPPQQVPPLDKIGFILFGAALAGLTFGFSALSETTEKNSTAFSITAFAIILLMGYILHSRKQSHPIVKIQLLQFKTFQISVLANLIVRLCFGGPPFLIPLLLQIGLGFSPQLAGTLLAPIAGGVLLAKPFALPLLRWYGYKRLLITNTWLACLFTWAFASINLHTPLYIIGCLTFIYGFILSLQYGAMNSLAYAEITPENMSAATSIMGTLQQIGQSFGVAVSALFLRFFSSLFTGHFVLIPKVFHYTFFAIGFFTLASILIFVRLQPTDGQQLLDKK